MAQLDSNFGPDLAVSNQNSGTVAILLRQAGGGFAPAPGSPIAVGATPLGLAAADLDGDDDPDLAVANWGADTISVLRNEPLGFTTAFTLATGDEPYGLAAGDFDRDGRQDLAVSHAGDSTIGIHLRTDAGFTEGYGSPVGDVFDPLRLIAADLDRDGRTDLAIPNHNADTVALLRNVRGTRITSGPDGLHQRRTPTFTFESDAAGASFECALDGGAFTACDTPFTTAALPDGAHVFAVRAVGDPRPPRARSPSTRSPPETTITSGPEGFVPTAPDYGFEANEPGARFECRTTAPSPPAPPPRPRRWRSRRLRLPGARDRPGRQRRPDARRARVHPPAPAARGPAAAQRRPAVDPRRPGRPQLHLPAGNVGARRTASSTAGTGPTRSRRTCSSAAARATASRPPMSATRSSAS